MTLFELCLTHDDSDYLTWSAVWGYYERPSTVKISYVEIRAAIINLKNRFLDISFIYRYAKNYSFPNATRCHTEVYKYFLNPILPMFLTVNCFEFLYLKLAICVYKNTLYNDVW